MKVLINRTHSSCCLYFFLYLLLKNWNVEKKTHTWYLWNIRTKTCNSKKTKKEGGTTNMWFFENLKFWKVNILKIWRNNTWFISFFLSFLKFNIFKCWVLKIWNCEMLIFWLFENLHLKIVFFQFITLFFLEQLNMLCSFVFYYKFQKIYMKCWKVESLKQNVFGILKFWIFENLKMWNNPNHDILKSWKFIFVDVFFEMCKKHKQNSLFLMFFVF